MKIEPGKFYRDREGHIHGPMCFTKYEGAYPFSDLPLSDSRRRDYTASGEFYGDGVMSPLDLVEEVPVIPEPDPNRRDTAGLYSITIEVPRKLIGSVRIVALEDDTP